MANKPTSLQLQRLVDPPPQRKPQQKPHISQLCSRYDKLLIIHDKLLKRVVVTCGRLEKANRKHTAVMQRITASGGRLEKLKRRIAALEAAARGA